MFGKTKDKSSKKRIWWCKKKKKKESIEIWDADVDNVEKYYTKKFHKYCVLCQFTIYFDDKNKKKNIKEN